MFNKKLENWEKSQEAKWSDTTGTNSEPTNSATKDKNSQEKESQRRNLTFVFNNTRSVHAYRQASQTFSKILLIWLVAFISTDNTYDLLNFWLQSP